jgi:hypothetical protein
MRLGCHVAAELAVILRQARLAAGVAAQAA